MMYNILNNVKVAFIFIIIGKDEIYINTFPENIRYTCCICNRNHDKKNTFQIVID